ncbi:hypothetical protein OTK49_28355 [Vibrio coralliirubri]|uniref:hypothetical protein n=1 Tax=Vibrio coralliirubri TaxID=1516159 RepID=UPI002284694F|nr:hypothetical protein [Vibrio coralliirubri]MCY9866456.1 hypothetical protein [Vibrio coralliirubri]
MATMLKASLIINVRLNMGVTPDEQPIIPFGLVHNAKGTAIINWTVGKMAPSNNPRYDAIPLSEASYDLSQLGEIKLNQLSYISLLGHEEMPTYVHQVLDGKIRNIEEKIAKIATEAENGSRHLILVEDEESGSFFYSALGLVGANGEPRPNSAQMLNEGVLSILPPYELYEM